VSRFRLSLDDVRRARETLRPHLPATPLRRTGLADAKGTGELLLKLECWQPTGSFKVRGATNLLASLSPDERRRGVVAASAGNHALGVAFAAERLGGALRTTLFVPRTAPRSKVRKLERFPVDVREAGETYDDAVEAAQAFERDTGAVFVHAFDDARTAAGQGTIGLELMEERPDLATVVVPVGGGGLVAGVATVVKALAPDVRIVAVQPEASPALRESIRLGRPLLTYPAGPTLADGLSGGIGHVAFDHRDLVDEVVTVSEAEIEDAIVALVASDQVVAEASGAVGIAAVRAGRVPGSAHGPVAVVVTGGNLDAPVLARLMAARYPETAG
jgi:threonine dehydratase